MWHNRDSIPGHDAQESYALTTTVTIQQLRLIETGITMPYVTTVSIAGVLVRRPRTSGTGYCLLRFALI